jgi:alpha-galactosidase/6-phospho-beta-glucosidase family protein
MNTAAEEPIEPEANHTAAIDPTIELVADLTRALMGADFVILQRIGSRNTARTDAIRLGLEHLRQNGFVLEVQPQVLRRW